MHDCASMETSVLWIHTSLLLTLIWMIWLRTLQSGYYQVFHIKIQFLILLFTIVRYSSCDDQTWERFSHHCHWCEMSVISITYHSLVLFTHIVRGKYWDASPSGTRYGLSFTPRSFTIVFLSVSAFNLLLFNWIRAISLGAGFFCASTIALYLLMTMPTIMIDWPP